MSILESLFVDPLLPKPKRQKLEPNIIESSCEHWFVCEGICISCNSTVDKTLGRSFDYLDKDIKMSDEAVFLSKRVISQMSWLQDKKLHLVLDLDHTLLHSIMVSKLSESGKCLTQEAESRRDLWRFKIGEDDELLIKLRPFVHEFLREAKEMFSMYVYTKGSFEYAQYVLELIDPNKSYFGDRVITRRESPGSKTLDLVLADERGVVIVDDKRSVWPHHKRNLLQVAKYRYFTRDRDGLAQESKGAYSSSIDERDENGPLANVLRLLKEVHRGFFSGLVEEKLYSVDVRPLLQDPLRSKRKNIKAKSQGGYIYQYE